MRGRFNRALLAAAAVVVTMATGAGSLAAGLDGLSVPESRFVSTLETPIQLAPVTNGQQEMLRNPLDEVSGSLYLGDGITLQSGFNVDVGRMLDRYASSGLDGLFYSPASLGSPYTSLSNGGSYFGLGAHLMEGLDIGIGQATSSPGLNRYLVNSQSAMSALGGQLPYDTRYTDSLLAGLTWNFAKWGGIGLTATQVTERGGVLGLANPGIGTARTNALGVSAHVGFGGGWVTTASYSEGSTQLNLRPGALAPDAVLRTEAYGVAVAKHGLFSKNDALGVAFAHPAPNFNNTSIGDSSNDLQFFGRDKLFQGPASETDIELGYKTEFFGDTIALQANAAYQMNFGGQKDNNAVSLLSRAKIKF